ncbi:MAG: hypothetical protein H6Q30_2100, partial [Bacteroidetes bacterium]|nr:hypothetical protein [Bacteroidota bacterium]
MPTKQYGEKTVEIDADGHMANRADWDAHLAEVIA